MATYRSSHTGGQVDTAVNQVINNNVKVQWGNVIGTLANQTDLNTALAAKENLTNKVTSLSSASTNTEYPSAKAVYTELEGKADLDLSNISSDGKSALDWKYRKSIAQEYKLYDEAEGYELLEKQKRSTFDKSKFTVVGSPTITDDGIASGFTTTDYLYKDLTITGTNIVIKGKANLVYSADGKMIEAFADSSGITELAIRYWGTNGLQLGIRTSDTSIPIEGYAYNSNGVLEYEVNIINGVSATYTFIIDGVKVVDNKTFGSVPNINLSKIYIGAAQYGAGPFNVGSIDLKQFSIIVDGVEVWNGNKTGIDQITSTLEIPYNIAKNGNKIVDSYYRDRVQQMYDDYGYTPYYTIDEDNQNYTLDTVKPQYAPSILYPSRSAGFKTPQFLVADKQTLTVKGKTSIWLNNGQYMTFLDDQSFTITSLLDTGSSLTAGKDYYVYATTDQKLVISLDATAPSGYTTYTATKIGGFHTICRTVTSSNAPVLVTTSGYTSFWSTHPAIGYTAGDAIPISTWTIAHRPYSSPAGMVYVSGDYGEEPFWGDIYLQSGTGSSTASAFGGTITSSRNPIAHQFDMNHVGKKLMSDSQFTIFAEGSNNKTNISGSAQPSPFTAGGHVDTASQAMISGFFGEECCGLVWQWLDEIAPTGGSAWNAYVNTERGQSYGIPYVLGAGGVWSDSTYCGSWSRASTYTRSLVSAARGARGASRCLPWNYFD